MHHDFLELELPRYGRTPRQEEEQYLRSLISSTLAQVIFISKTKNDSFTSSDLTDAFHVDNSYIVPVVHASGGLWLLWNVTS